MSCGCGTNHEDGKSIVNKLREKGFSNRKLEQPFTIKCVNCEKQFIMLTLEVKCPSCLMTYGVTPCSSDSVENVQPADINY